MIKWIKNSKGAVTNNTSNYKGVRKNHRGKFEASVLLSNYDHKSKRKQHRFHIATCDTEKEAVQKRIEYILNIL